MNAQVVLIDDFASAVGFIRGCFPYSSHGVSFDSPAAFGMAASVDNRTRIKENLAGLTGPLLLILDLSLYNDAVTRGAVRKEIVTTLEGILKAAPPDRDAGVISDALEALGWFRGLTAVEDVSWFDGLEFGLEAIQNRDVHPLLIRLATTLDSKDKMASILDGLAEAIRGKPSCCHVGLYPDNIRELYTRSVENPNEKDVFLTRRIDRDAKKISEMAPGCGSVDPVDVLQKYLSWAKSFDHSAFSNMPDSLLEDKLVPLLGIEQAHWKEFLRPHLVKHLRVAIRYCGTTLVRGLGVLPAWLLALSAYQHADKSRDWRDIFDPRQISECDGIDWAQMLITPHLTEDSGERVRSLHDAIKHYYRMCWTLFLRESQNPQGPLIKVALRREKGQCCLSLRLAFNAWEETGGRPCLAENISRWRSGYLGNSGTTDHRWDKPFEKGPNSSARAIWNWWLATAVHDYPYGAESVFGTSTYLPMRMESIEGQTELFFGDRK